MKRTVERVSSFFLNRYQDEPLAVSSSLRILLAVLLLATLAVLLTGPLTILANPNVVVRAFVVGVMAFFPFLLWLLRTGRRLLVVVLFTVVVSLFATVPYLVDALTGFSASKIDRMSFQILLQLILISAISERAAILVLGFVLMACVSVLQFLVTLGSLAGESQDFLVTVFIRMLLNLTLATGVLWILQRSYHRAIGQVEAANRTLEVRVRERTEQLQQAQRSLVEGERLAVLGRLSASVAHEINTPLGAIQSSAQTIRSLVPGVLDRAVPLFRRLTVEQEEVLIEIMGHSLEGTGIQGLERRSRQKEMGAELSAWGIPDPPGIAVPLIDAGIPTLSPRWRPLLSGPLATEVVLYISDVSAILRSGQIIAEATKKAAHYILALRQYYDQNVQLPLVPVDLSQTVEEVVSLLQGRIGPGIQVHKDLVHGLQVVGQPGRLMQVWDNLITNALDAMGAEGTLTLTCRPAGSDIEVAVTDTGPGIPPDIQEKLFDPFVTTKPFGASTGIGLGIVKAIIEEHEGSLTFASTPGNTQFRIRLPQAPGKEP